MIRRSRKTRLRRWLWRRRSVQWAFKHVNPATPCKDSSCGGRHAQVYGEPVRRGFNVYWCPCGTTYQPERWFHRVRGPLNPFLRPGEPPRWRKKAWL